MFFFKISDLSGLFEKLAVDGQHSKINNRPHSVFTNIIQRKAEFGPASGNIISSSRIRAEFQKQEKLNIEYIKVQKRLQLNSDPIK